MHSDPAWKVRIDVLFFPRRTGRGGENGPAAHLRARTSEHLVHDFQGRSGGEHVINEHHRPGLKEPRIRLSEYERRSAVSAPLRTLTLLCATSVKSVQISARTQQMPGRLQSADRWRGFQQLPQWVPPAGEHGPVGGWRPDQQARFPGVFGGCCHRSMQRCRKDMTQPYTLALFERHDDISSDPRVTHGTDDWQRVQVLINRKRVSRLLCSERSPRHQSQIPGTFTAEHLACSAAAHAP